MAAKAVANTMKTSLGPNGKRLNILCFSGKLYNIKESIQPVYRKLGDRGGHPPPNMVRCLGCVPDLQHS